MNLVPIDINTIRLNWPLPFSLRTEDGTLLAPKGYAIERRFQLDTMVMQRGKLFIDITDSESHHRDYMSRLHSMVYQDRELGKIAEASVEPITHHGLRIKEITTEVNWFDLQDQAHSILRDVQSPEFLQRLEKLKGELLRQVRLNPDCTLFALIHLAATELRRYSATHAMLVGVVCVVAAQDVLKWADEDIHMLLNASLTMNIGMTELHDRLASQMEAPNAEQILAIRSHPERSRDILLNLGIENSGWLDAVVGHRSTLSGPLGQRATGERIARLIQRADIFAARLSPRASRPSDSPTSAIQSCYFDENRQMDEAGAALIKAVGVYSPGTFVKLANNEIAVVVRRGLNTTMPKVAVLINRHGMLIGEPILRETSHPEFRIVGSLPHRDVKVNHNFERLLALAKQSSQDQQFRSY